MTIDEILTYVTLADMLIDNTYLHMDTYEEFPVYRMRFRDKKGSVGTILHYNSKIMRCSMTICNGNLGTYCPGEVTEEDLMKAFF